MILYINKKGDEHMKKLTKTEYKYMCIIWEHPEGIASNEIYKGFTQTMGSQSTILHRIVEKGYARSVQRGKSVYYYPQIPQIDYDRAMLNAELNKKMGINSINDLFAAFCGRKSLQDYEIQKLNNLIEELVEKNDK